MATDPSNIRLSDEQKLRLAEAADVTGLTPNQLIEDALRIAFGVKGRPGATGRTLYDAIAEDDAIGCIKGGPIDVSTNPKYMEGFGTSDNGNNST